MTTPYRIKTLSELHQLRGLPKLMHPLISVINVGQIESLPDTEQTHFVFDFYMIALKRNFSANVKVKYGQQPYDFNEGVMAFTAPGQVLSIELEQEPAFNHSGWLLLVHPDFLWHTPLAKTIQHYDYFGYSVNEALFLSEKEETIVTNLILTIEQEYQANIDSFSQTIIVSQLEVLLNYAQRFYQRQFVTRKRTNHHILDRLDALLTDYFNQDELLKSGLPTVQFIADRLNVSPDYLRGLLKTLTGRNTQQHIHDKLIERAKEHLSTTNLSVTEIAYALGFEHSQSFSKLFKSKTNLTPVAFRQSFN